MALLHTETSGSGPTIVLWHGWGMNLRVFDALRAALSADFQVIAVDLPGHGRSDWPGALDADGQLRRVGWMWNGDQREGAIGNRDAVVGGAGLHNAAIAVPFEGLVFLEYLRLAILVEEGGPVARMLDEMHGEIAFEHCSSQARRLDVDVAMVAVVMKGDAAGDCGDDVVIGLNRINSGPAVATVERGRSLEVESGERVAIHGIDRTNARLGMVGDEQAPRCYLPFFLCKHWHGSQAKRQRERRDTCDHCPHRSFSLLVWLAARRRHCAEMAAVMVRTLPRIISM